MKKNFIKLFSALVILMICSPLAADDAVVTFVKGKVEVLKGENWVALNVGDKISQSDTISTGFQSEAKIKFNGSLMALGALTRVTMDQLSSGENKENVDVYLSTGAVRSKVTHTEDTRVSYTVRSPVAVASVRGTDFDMTAKGKVRCFEGAVAVYPNTVKRNADGSFDVVVEEKEEQTTEGEAEGVVESEEPAENEGISGSEEGSGETSGNEAGTDNGPATPTTPANQINDKAPSDSVVVGASQQTTFTKAGTPEKPADNAKKTINKVKSAVSTQAAKEAVSSSGTTPTDVVQASVAPTTGSITITITFED